jgi:hypothetical protein
MTTGGRQVILMMKQKQKAGGVKTKPRAAQKNGASPPRFQFFSASASGLRLRLQPGIRVGPRARLAGRRHRRGAWRGRLQHRLAVRLLALEQVLDLVAAQRFEFEVLIGPLRNVYAVSDKVLTMALSGILITGSKHYPAWLEVGVGMVAVSSQTLWILRGLISCVRNLSRL